MTVAENTRVLFNREPKGLPTNDDFKIVKEQIQLDTVPLKDGEVLVKTLFLSLDPYMRGRMRVNVASYAASWQIGQPANGGTVVEVVRSLDPKFVAGDKALSFGTWETYTVVAGKSLTKVDAPAGIPLSYYLGVLGMPGLTAYAGLLKLGKPKAGETLYVSSAAGAVGQVVVGSAGSDDKVEFIKTLGYDKAFNYKTINHDKALETNCPDGIDIYFEQVGGGKFRFWILVLKFCLRARPDPRYSTQPTEMLDSVIMKMNNFGRIPLCGMISQYNSTGEMYGVKNLIQAVGKRLELHGFIVSDYSQELQPQFMADMLQWISEKKMVYKEEVAVGLESAPAAFIGMLQGKNFGKQVVQV
ncbi:hypothetical protein SmJEL517_g05606 [Synchytrium microbalum]|uniref:Oxidoreductase N-terminal domain-containing protein n=1 Tax=Synchytrium microbalum TaxID=1806994 RepID=A0A507BYY3_9FUNG|nr:uncharacterized protein SmJEL517_g05606 [Synchytrium microbalum]TPX30956.1 hypothetical protein SmJEL517_g05606 [Synchytrium microbalum]